jgi:uncharacterized repeat protein (TIGR01451 family)
MCANRKNDFHLVKAVVVLILLLSISKLEFLLPSLASDYHVLLPASKIAHAASKDSSSPLITAGSSHTCAIRNGALYCWGNNYSGQLGDGTTTNRNVPFAVHNMNSGVTAVSAGARHTCAIKDGALYCWGNNSFGQLGDGTTTDRTAPVPVQNMGSSVTAVSAGNRHTCAIKDGALYCWGSNFFGQLGDGTTADSTTPVAVHNMSTATAVAANESYTCAIKSGALYCWGRNRNGRLGNGTQVDSLTPVAVNSMTSGVTSVSTGMTHACAVKSGALHCWGWNYYGQLGDGTTIDRTAPVAVQNMGSSVVSVAAGVYHTCAIKDGSLYCWGRGQFLGNWDTSTDRTTPVVVQSMNSGVAAVAIGETHTLGQKVDTCLYGWGYNNYGELGTGTIFGSPTPVLVNGGCGSMAPVSPGAFSKSLPTNGAIDLLPNVTLGWSAPTAGAVHSYLYCYATAVGCTPNIQVPSTMLSATATNLTLGATYHWQVRACAESTCSVFTDASGGYWSFTVTTTSVTFSKSVPVDGATGLTTNLTLAWNAVSATIHHYRYCYDTTPGCTPIIQVPNTIFNATVAGLVPETTYHWQVRACADSECAVFVDADGGHWSFTTATTPEAFSKNAPADGATEQPTNLSLSWNAAGGAVSHYRYCYATTSGCEPATDAGIGTSIVLSGLTPGATYHWQVRACADSECAVFVDADGGHWSFVVQSMSDNLNNSVTRKVVTPALVRMGELVTYTIFIKNVGGVMVTARITDVLPLSTTLISATPQYAWANAQTLVWNEVNVPAGEVVALTVTIRPAARPPLGSYTLITSVLIGTVDGEITRSAPPLTVEPWRIFVPTSRRP